MNTDMIPDGQSRKKSNLEANVAKQGCAVCPTWLSVRARRAPERGTGALPTARGCMSGTGPAESWRPCGQFAKKQTGILHYIVPPHMGGLGSQQREAGISFPVSGIPLIQRSVDRRLWGADRRCHFQGGHHLQGMTRPSSSKHVSKLSTAPQKL